MEAGINHPQSSPSIRMNSAKELKIEFVEKRKKNNRNINYTHGYDDNVEMYVNMFSITYSGNHIHNTHSECSIHNFIP